MKENQYYEPTPVPNKPVSGRSWFVTLLLVIFLGYLGIHRFYAGKAWTGFLYMFTGGLIAIGWIIDLIRLVTGTFTDKQGLPIIR